MLKNFCIAIFLIFISNSEDGDDDEGMFSRFCSVIGIPKRSENRERIDGDKSDTDIVTDSSRAVKHKNSSSLYTKILLYFGLKLPQSEYEQYELVQSFTDSLGIDTESDSMNLTSNEESETDLRL